MSNPFIRHLFRNLRISFFLAVVVAVVVVGYAILNKEDAEWRIVTALGIGMFISSLFNAWSDARKKKSV